MNQLHSDARVSIAGRSPGLRPESVEAVVTVPTFRRPEQLLATLESLARQMTDRHYAVIVVENDAERCEGAEAALGALLAPLRRPAPIAREVGGESSGAAVLDKCEARWSWRWRLTTASC